MDRATVVYKDGKQCLQMDDTISEQVRPCDGCTVCCYCCPIFDTKPGAIVKETDKIKQAFTHCEFEAESGCACYETRPIQCMDFTCAWAEGIIPESFKPSRTGCLISRVEVKDGDKVLVSFIIAVSDKVKFGAYSKRITKLMEGQDFTIMWNGWEGDFYKKGVLHEKIRKPVQVSPRMNE